MDNGGGSRGRGVLAGAIVSRAGQDRENRSLPRRLEYAAARVVAGVLGVLPTPVAYLGAEWTMALVLLAAPSFRRRARKHVEIAFGDTKPPREREAIVRESFRRLAWYLADVLTVVPRLRDPKRLDAVDLSEVESVFRRDGVGEKGGALLVSGHLGVPEVASLAMALRGRPNSAIVRRPDNVFLWEHVLRRREGIDRPMLTKHGSLRAAHRTLRRNGLVGVQIDQDARSRGVFVRYFGRRASTHTGAATLALLARVPVYLVVGLRSERRRFAYRVYCEGPIEFTPSGDHDADVKELTQHMTAALEDFVRRHPETVMWAHRRWKTRPPGMKRLREKLGLT